MQSNQFAGKTVLITGAAKRLGRSMALAFAQSGARLIIHCSRSVEEAGRLAQEIRRTGTKAVTASRDLSNPDGLEEWMHRLIRESGPVDILVNSASEYPEDTYETMDGAALNRAMNILVQSPLVLMRSLHAAARPCSVVNILDARVGDRDPAHASYHLGKRSLHTLTRDLAQAWAPLMRVNAVAPGVVLPPDGFSLEEGRRWMERLEKSYPLDGPLTPDAVTEAVLYLAGARAVTGQTLFVDGGRHLKGNAYGL